MHFCLQKVDLHLIRSSIQITYLIIRVGILICIRLGYVIIQSELHILVTNERYVVIAIAVSHFPSPFQTSLGNELPYDVWNQHSLKMEYITMFTTEFNLQFKLTSEPTFVTVLRICFITA